MKSRSNGENANEVNTYCDQAIVELVNDELWTHAQIVIAVGASRQKPVAKRAWCSGVVHSCCVLVLFYFQEKLVFF